LKPVFVDSGGFFALLVQGDAAHSSARILFEQAQAESWRLITTNAVVIETYALLLVRTREGRSKAIEFLDRLDRTTVHVERVHVEDERQAIALVRAHTTRPTRSAMP
jgi:predicted nucleic acid-binding protein